MATQAQILANRRNAQKSTGPRTAEGKGVSAKNATKHGFFAQSDVVISEDQGDFDAFCDEMLAELAPVGVMESVLARRIVSLTWRLRRTERMQNELIDVKIRREINDTWPELSETLITGKPCDKSKYSDKCYDDQVLGYIAMRDFGGARALERLSMYERRLEASLFRTMAELKRLQHARKMDQSESTETEAISYRGRDAHETQGRDALTTAHETAMAKPSCGGRDARDTECAKQSQSAAAREELSPFEKKEYELLTQAAPRRNKANSPATDAEPGVQEAEKRLRRGTLVCRY
jgi:hypothetical protein